MYLADPLLQLLVARSFSLIALKLWLTLTALRGWSPKEPGSQSPDKVLLIHNLSRAAQLAY